MFRLVKTFLIFIVAVGMASTIAILAFICYVAVTADIESMIPGFWGSKPGPA